MRPAKTGQPLDHLFRKLNQATTVKDLEELKVLALKFRPRSRYEVKDKHNLLVQINEMQYWLE